MSKGYYNNHMGRVLSRLFNVYNSGAIIMIEKGNTFHAGKLHCINRKYKWGENLGRPHQLLIIMCNFRYKYRMCLKYHINVFKR